MVYCNSPRKTVESLTQERQRTYLFNAILQRPGTSAPNVQKELAMRPKFPEGNKKVGQGKAGTESSEEGGQGTNKANDLG